MADLVKISLLERNGEDITLDEEFLLTGETVRLEESSALSIKEYIDKPKMFKYELFEDLVVPLGYSLIVSDCINANGYDLEINGILEIS